MKSAISKSIQEEDNEPQASTSKEHRQEELNEDEKICKAINTNEQNESVVTEKDDHDENKSEINKQWNEFQVTLSADTVLKKDGTEDSNVICTHVRPHITITADSSPSPEKRDPSRINLEEGKPHCNEQHARGSCPIYFGIKSYLHNFYDPPDKEVVNSGEYIQEDDFEFLVEPGKRRWRGCWLRTGLWVGINLTLLGVIALLVGHLTPVRNTIVGHEENLEILDRWAITFNRRLELCRLAGLVAFCCGAVVVMVTLIIYSYQQETMYYVLGATIIPEMFFSNQLEGRQRLQTSRIPVTGSIRSVQPIYLCPKIK